jgi:hypothetical protein
MPGNTIAELQVKVGADVSGVHTGMKTTQKDIKDTADSARAAEPHAKSFLQGALGGALELAKAAPGIGMFASSVGDLASGLVEGNAQFETFTTQFAVLLKGSDDMGKGMERAKARIGELSTFAATTPFELPQVVQAGKVLEAFGLQGEKSMKRFGLSTTDVMTVVGDAAAGSGADFAELANTFGKFASGSTGEALSRLQELGIVTREQLSGEGIKFDKSGALVSSVDDTFKAIVAHIHGSMGGMMNEQSKTFDGMVGNLQDWIGQTKRMMMQPIFDALKDNLGSLLNFLGSDGVKNALTGLATMFAQGLGNALNLLGTIIGTVGPPLGNLLTNVIGGGMKLIGQAWALAQPFVDGFTAFLSANLAEGGGMDITNFIQGLPAPLAALGQYIGDVVANFQAFFDALASGEGFISAVGDLISNNLVAGLYALGASGGVIGTVVNAFNAIEQALQTLWDTLTSGGDIGQALGTAFGAILPAVSDLGGSLLDFVMGTLLPNLANALVQLGVAFVAWIGPMIPPFLAQLQAWAQAAWDWFSTNLPGWMAKLAEWAAALVNWVLPMIPPLLGFLGELLGNVLGWIVGTALPALLDNLGKWAVAFVDWVGPQIPPLLTQLGILAGQMWDWITGTALPTIMQKLGQWASAFVDWVGPRIGPLLGELAKLLGSLVGWLVGTALPAILLKLGEWALAFVSWVVPQIPKLIGFLGQLLGSLGGWIIGTALPAIVKQLAEWAGAFLNWIGTSVLPFIGQKLGEFGAAILSWLGQEAYVLQSKAGEMGSQLINGLTGALAAGRDRVVSFIIGIAQGALDAIKDFFGIHSPSTAMHDVGAYTVQGFTDGMTAGTDAAVGAVNAFGTAVRAAWDIFFGPFTQDGTLINMLFRGDDQGFFWNLGRGTDLALTTVTFQWVGLMAHLKDEVNNSLGEMAIGVRSEAAAVADSMIEGFLAALSAGAGQVQAAIAATFAAPGGAGVPGGAAGGSATGSSGGGGGGGTMMMATGGFAPIGTRVVVGENGPESGVVTRRGLYISPNSNLAAPVAAGNTVQAGVIINGLNVTPPPAVARWLTDVAQRKHINNRGVDLG